MRAEQKTQPEVGWQYALTARQSIYGHIVAVSNAMLSGHIARPPSDEEVREFSLLIHGIAPGSDLIYVEREFVDLILAGGDSLPAEVSLEPQMLPAAMGFVFFGRPVPEVTMMSAVHGPIPLAGLSWVSSKHVGHMAVEAWADAGPGQPLYPAAGLPQVFGQPLDDALGAPTFGTDPETGDMVDASELQLQAARRAVRLVFSLFLFINQKIAQLEKPRLSRQQRRRLARASEPEPNVLVVSLRKEHRQSIETGEGVKLEYRVPVRTHWHRYWCGEARSHLEWRLVDLYWRGPEGAPEKPVVQRVFDVRR